MAAKLNIKLPMPDKQKLKIMSAKFNAWWNGNEYVEDLPQEDSQSETAANDAAQSAENPNVAPIAPSDVPKPAHNPTINTNSNIQAAAILWGTGRLTPSNQNFDNKLIADLELNKNSRFGFFCAEAGAQVSNIINAGNCKTEGYFIDKEVKDAAIKYVKEAGFEKLYSGKIYDGAPKTVPKNRFDKVLMVYLSSTQKETEANIFALARMLKPKGIASWVNFVAREGETRLEETSGNERRQFLTHEDIIPAFEASGLKVLSEDEYGADLLNAYYKRQESIIGNWDAIQAQLLQAGGIGAVQAALEQTLVWRARIDAIKTGRLSLKRILLAHS